MYVEVTVSVSVKVGENVGVSDDMVFVAEPVGDGVLVNVYVYVEVDDGLGEGDAVYE